MNRLSVDGRDYFLPDPVAELKSEILLAIRAGGDYVNIPALRGGPGVDILFSPGMPVMWSQIDMDSDNDSSAESGGHLDASHDEHYGI